MNYPENLEQVLGFDQIREILTNHCLGEEGKRKVADIHFLTDYKKLKEQLSMSSELLQEVKSGSQIPLKEYPDIEPFLSKLHLEGFFISTDELADLRQFLNRVATGYNFLQNPNRELDTVRKHFDDISLDISLLNKIESTIDEEGNVKDDASPALKEIRKDKIKAEERVRKSAERFLEKAQKEKKADDQSLPTVRNGRIVVPLFSEYKRQTPGIVHDESNTGQTAFFEPTEMVGLNNEVKELQAQEERLVHELLLNLSHAISDSADYLSKVLNFLGELDMLVAKATLGHELDANVPELSKDQKANWLNARHPNLMLKLKERDEEVVSFSLNFDDQYRVLVISGPNAGGKSICLKATGLLQYMIQCGVPVPMEKSSTIGIFDSIFADIGDQQSVESDLSTYSAHLINMNEFLKGANSNSMILLDELGTGTEPKFGAAIAESFLSEIMKSQPYGVITTHFDNIKQMADEHDDMINANMLYDIKNLKPLYELEIGKWGSSYAFEVASNLGIDKKVLKNAKEIVGDERTNVEQLLATLQNENRTLKEKSEELTRKEKSARESFEQMKEMTEHLRSRKEDIVQEAKRDAQRLIKEANKRIERVIREIKENEADKEKTKALRKELEDWAENQSADEEQVQITELKVGDHVKMKGSDVAGKVTEIKGGRARIQIGELVSSVKVSDLEPTTVKTFKPLRKEGYVHKFDKTTFRTSIDIRGKKIDEATQEVEQLIDKAIMYGEDRITILHGKGSGALRTHVRNLLKEYNQVEKIEDEHPDQGGDGITIVTLN